ncbi:hypothetical protein GW17_00030082 [Ensete ventricosum]|nr:hypothetical protein GW17_00030082 [Ensete ventricosum]
MVALLHNDGCTRAIAAHRSHVGAAAAPRWQRPCAGKNYACDDRIGGNHTSAKCPYDCLHAKVVHEQAAAAPARVMAAHGHCRRLREKAAPRRCLRGQ